MKELGVKAVQVSLDGASAQTFERMRVRGNFDRTLDGLRNLAAAGVPVEINFSPACFNVHEIGAIVGIALKIETDGSHIDDSATDRLSVLGVECIQISVDGATAATHARVRPGSSFAAAVVAIERLVARGRAPQLVFVPTRFNLHEIVAAFDLAETLGCGAFVTGPLMRIGRAAGAWQRIACSSEEWRAAVAALRERAASMSPGMALSIYPWDILAEMETRIERPQAMLLVVPNGNVKLLNALPFAAADLRRDSLEDAWRAYRDAWRAPEVREFITRCRSNPALLKHANETWPMVRNDG
jgi:MoaA/NifB/PqqE/SkfB family radical SAM enzyme